MCCSCLASTHPLVCVFQYFGSICNYICFVYFTVFVLSRFFFFFFFNDPAPPEISTLSLHDALPICRPGYEITAGTVSYEGRDLLALAPEERARQGVFLGFQYPVEIPGVNNVYLLKAGVNAVRKQRGLPEVDAFEFLGLVRDKMKLDRKSTRL